MAVLLAALVIVIALARDRDEVLATNGIDPAVFVREVEPRDRTCEIGPPSSPEAGAYAVVAGGFGTDVRLSLETSSGRRLASADGDGPGGLVTFRIDERAAGVTRLCFRNLGTSRVALAGERSPAEARVAVYALDRDPPTWLAKAPGAIDAVGTARGAALGASGWLAVGLGFVGAFLGVATVAHRAWGTRS